MSSRDHSSSECESLMRSDDDKDLHENLPALISFFKSLFVAAIRKIFE